MIYNNLMNVNKDLHYMDIAFNLAIKAAKRDEVPVGCVIVSRGKVIAKGFNLKEKGKSPILHAEMVAIRKACKKLKRWRLSDCDIYVTLEPCTMCMGAIISARFNRLIFGAYDPKAGACGSVYDLNEGLLNHTLPITAGVKGEESSRILKDYFIHKRKVKKSEKN